MCSDVFNFDQCFIDLHEMSILDLTTLDTRPAMRNSGANDDLAGGAGKVLTGQCPTTDSPERFRVLDDFLMLRLGKLQYCDGLRRNRASSGWHCMAGGWQWMIPMKVGRDWFMGRAGGRG